MTGTLYQPPTWADLALERMFPDLEDVTMTDPTDAAIEAKSEELTERWLKDSDGSIINYIVRHFLALYDAPARIPTRSALDSALDLILGNSNARRAVVDAVLGVVGGTAGAIENARSPTTDAGDDAIPLTANSIRIAMNNVDVTGGYPSAEWETRATELIFNLIRDRAGDPQLRARIATLEAELAAAKSASVGTIRLGEGLTEAQEGWPAQIKLCEAEIFDEMRKAMERFVWEDTAQGFDYWRDVSINAERIADALRASAAPKAEAVDWVKQAGSWRAEGWADYDVDTILRGLCEQLTALRSAAGGSV